jgi:hypothetical protein
MTKLGNPFIGSPDHSAQLNQQRPSSRKPPRLVRHLAIAAVFCAVITFVFALPRVVMAQLPRSLEILGKARAAWFEGNLARAEALLSDLAQRTDVPEHHRQEAQELLEILRRHGRDGFFAAAKPTRRSLPEFRPTVRFYVSPSGNDDNPGSDSQPFATLERARQAVRDLKRAGLPPGGVAVVIRGGVYPVRQTFRLCEEDSGTADSPVIYQAAYGETPVFSGGLRLTEFRPVREPAILERLPEVARPHVLQVDLNSLGIQRVSPLVLGGFASGRGFRTFPLIELYWDKKPLVLARWPNQGFVHVQKVSEQNPINTWAGPGTSTGPIYFLDDRLSRWAKEPEVLLYGYWYWGWADSYELVERIDPATGAIFLKPPHARYGYASGRPFYALNLLCELDSPGEWYLDRTSGMLYVWPPSDPAKAEAELALFAEPFVVLENTRHIYFERITWELGAADAIYIRGAEQCVFAGCTVRCFAGDGVIFGEAQLVTEQATGPIPVSGSGLLSCDIYTMGRGGVVLSGGDRRLLVPGKNFVENCHIYELSRIDHTYTPAVLVSGVGHHVAYNLMHDIGSSAIRLGGNDHLVEFNEVFRAVLESDDQGAVDMFGDPTFRGNVFRYNYWHHIGGWQDPRQADALYRAGIRFDDAISGNLVYGNVFYRASVGRQGFGGVQIHGGKDNIVDNNLFLDCWAAISFSPWGLERWRQFVRGRLEKGDIDRQLYLRRYPELERLEEDPNVNFIYRNVAAGCQTLFLRDHRANVIGPNWSGKLEEAVTADRPGHFRLRQDAPFWKDLGFRPIPLESIGLYRDRYRSELPEAVRDAARAGL